MFDSPLSPSAYEVLGVESGVDSEALRRAFRARLRATHPDAGGDAAAFVQVQRAWELVGDAEARAIDDSGFGFTDDAETASWRGWRPPRETTDTRPRAQSFGIAGQWRRECYLGGLREWGGTGIASCDPYDPALVRGAPVAIRRLLADALAEEATARLVDDLGMGFTVWHDARAGIEPDTEVGAEAAERLGHLVIGPSGVYGLKSVYFGEPLRFRRGEVIGRDAAGRAPIATLLERMREISRIAKVRFSGAMLVVPDGALDHGVVELGRVRGVPAAVVRRSVLPLVLRHGLPGAHPLGGTDLFEVRTRLMRSVQVEG